MILLTIRAIAFTYLLIRTPIAFMGGDEIVAWIGALGALLFVWSILKDIER